MAHQLHIDADEIDVNIVVQLDWRQCDWLCKRYGLRGHRRRTVSDLAIEWNLRLTQAEWIDEWNHRAYWRRWRAVKNEVMPT